MQCINEYHLPPPPVALYSIIPQYWCVPWYSASYWNFDSVSPPTLLQLCKSNNSCKSCDERNEQTTKQTMQENFQEKLYNVCYAGSDALWRYMNAAILPPHNTIECNYFHMTEHRPSCLLFFATAVFIQLCKSSSHTNTTQHIVECSYLYMTEHRPCCLLSPSEEAAVLKHPIWNGVTIWNSITTSNLQQCYNLKQCNNIHFETVLQFTAVLQFETV